jgi:hypothetical protein
MSDDVAEIGETLPGFNAVPDMVTINPSPACNEKTRPSFSVTTTGALGSLNEYTFTCSAEAEMLMSPSVPRTAICPALV